MARTISTSQDKYCYSHFFTTAKNYQSSKDELNTIDSKFDLMTRKGCTVFLSSSLENGDKANYSIDIEGDLLNYSTGVISIQYLCYDLRSNGCYHGAPFKPLFNSSYFREKNISCDINYDYGQHRNGGSYITDVFANYLLSYFDLDSYESLLGKTYAIGKNDVSKLYTINNIISTSDEAGKSVFDSFGNFIITNDNTVFENEFCSIYFGISSDILLCYDMMNYFEKSEHDLLSLKIKESNCWLETSFLSKIKNDIKTHRKWSFNVLELSLLIVSFVCLIISVLSFIWLNKNNKLLLKSLLIIESFILLILIISNILFLFLPKEINLICIINFIVLTPFEVAFFCLLYSIIGSIKEKKNEN